MNQSELFAKTWVKGIASPIELLMVFQATMQGGKVYALFFLRMCIYV